MKRLNDKEKAIVNQMRGWIHCIKALNKGHRRKNKLIHRLRREIDRLNIELEHANNVLDFFNRKAS